MPIMNVHAVESPYKKIEHLFTAVSAMHITALSGILWELILVIIKTGQL